MNNQNSKNLFKEHLMNSTFIGIIKLFRSKRVLNVILWIVFNLLSVLTCFYFIMPLITNYFNYSVVTNIETIHEQPMEYPAFTLCHFFPTGINLSSFLIDCFIGYDKNCKKNPEKYFDTHGNNCLRFNIGSNMNGELVPVFNATVGGYDDSIQLIVSLSEYPGLLVIHDRNIHLHLSIENTFADNLFWIQKGYFNEYKLEKTVEIKLEEPYNNCLKDITKFEINTTLVDIFKNLNRKYTYTDCLSYCFELYYIESNPCNCTTLELTRVWDECYVNQKDDLIKDCTFQNRVEFSKDINKCKKYCPLECDSVDYFITNTVYYLEQDYTYIRIYFRNLKYTLITQQAKMNIFELIGSIGGTISLFIGLNFFSLFEIVELTFELILLLFNVQNQNRVFNFK